MGDLVSKGWYDRYKGMTTCCGEGGGEWEVGLEGCVVDFGGVEVTIGLWGRGWLEVDGMIGIWGMTNCGGDGGEE